MGAELSQLLLLLLSLLLLLLSLLLQLMLLGQLPIWRGSCCRRHHLTHLERCSQRTLQLSRRQEQLQLRELALQRWRGPSPALRKRWSLPTLLRGEERRKVQRTDKFEITHK